jgi:elongation factor Ts
MQITASMVKELRDRTGSGMMECKKALQEANGDIDIAIENMRKAGLAKADKKSGRVAAEGRVAIEISADGKSAAVVEVNCETDFVSGGDDFLSFVQAVAKTALANQPADLAALSEMVLDGASDTIEMVRKAMIAKIGENIQLRRFELLHTENGKFGSYLHGTRMGVLVEMENGSDDLIKDVAMHIAASNPFCVSESEVPAEVLEKEKEILRAQALDSGKPADIVEKMLVGRVCKYLAEITLLG